MNANIEPSSELLFATAIYYFCVFAYTQLSLSSAQEGKQYSFLLLWVGFYSEYWKWDRGSKHLLHDATPSWSLCSQLSHKAKLQICLISGQCDQHIWLLDAYIFPFQFLCIHLFTHNHHNRWVSNRARLYQPFMTCHSPWECTFPPLSSSWSM